MRIRSYPFTGTSFVLIPAGTFTMGTPASEPNSFYLGIHEVTQREWWRSS